MKSEVVTQNDIEEAMRKIGVRAGDCILVHSSLSSMGFVEGGADTVIDALLGVLGKNGTLVMPTFCQKEKERRFDTWDIERSLSDVGKITEIFRLRPGSIRSNHATHSVAAEGRLACAITEGHVHAWGRPGPWGDAAMGIGSSWQMLYELNAEIILIGVDFHVNSMVHLIEHHITERALSGLEDVRRFGLISRLHGWNKPGVWAGFDRMKLQNILDEMGLLSHGRCGNAPLLMVRAGSMVDTAIELMERAPREWFDDDFCNWLDESQVSEGER